MWLCITHLRRNLEIRVEFVASLFGLTQGELHIANIYVSLPRTGLTRYRSASPFQRVQTFDEVLVHSRHVRLYRLWWGRVKRTRAYGGRSGLKDLHD